MKKRIVTLACICAAALSLSACGTKADDAKETTAAAADAKDSEETDAAEAVADVGEEVEAEEEGTVAPVSEGPDRGSWDGLTYSNEYAGFSISFPEGWVAATDEELLAIMNLGGDYSDLDEAAYEKALEATFCPMGATDAATNTSNIFLMFENLQQTALFASNLSESDYLKALKTQLDTSSYTFVTEDGEKELAGQTYHYMEATASANGVSVTQFYVVRKIDNYMLAMIYTTTDMTLDDLAGMMTAL